MWQCIAKDMKVPWRSAESWHWYLAPKESTHNPAMMEEPSEAQHDIQYLKSHRYDETPASIQLDENSKRKFDADAPATFVKKQKVENRSLTSPANQYGTKDEQVVRVAEALPTHSITAANSVHDLSSALNQEGQMLHLRSIIEPAPMFPDQSARPRFFCTYCHEDGKTKVLKTK